MVFLKSILKTASVSITNNGGLKKLPDPNILMQLPGMFLTQFTINISTTHLI